jgi:hypothetical protein
MSRNVAIAALVGLSLTLAGCDDAFLDTLPPSQISDQIFWTQPQDALLAVNAIYRDVMGQDKLFLDNATDDSYAQKYFEAQGSQFYGNGSADANTGWGNGIWATNYRAISRANELLANIDRIQGLSPALADRYKGEASFLRAYYYNMLVSLYGDVPLILKVLTIQEGRDQTRTPKDQVVDQILEDLDYAASVLPTSSGPDDTGRATKGAALALKARAALYAGRFDVAAQAAKAVMDLGVYSLYPSYRELFWNVGEGNSEVIFDKQYVQNIASSSLFDLFAPKSLLGGNDNSPLRPLVDSYYMKDGLPITESPLYDASDPYANRDPRLYATILYPGAEFMGQTFQSAPNADSPDAAKSGFDATASGYGMAKYVDPADAPSRDNTGLNVILIRYADVLLMYAEAKNEVSGPDPSVHAALDEVRERVDMPDVAPGKSQDELREIIRHERRVELALEGLRLFDIRRWKIAEEVMPGMIYGIDYIDDDGAKQTVQIEQRRFQVPRDYLWGIPANEIILAPGLTQNPGW